MANPERPSGAPPQTLPGTVTPGAPTDAGDEEIEPKQSDDAGLDHTVTPGGEDSSDAPAATDATDSATKMGDSLEDDQIHCQSISFDDCPITQLGVRPGRAHPATAIPADTAGDDGPADEHYSTASEQSDGDLEPAHEETPTGDPGAQ